MATYSPEVEQTMQKYYATLSEKDQRRYAAIEALKLPPAEHRYIAELFGCSLQTVRRGLADLAALPAAPHYEPAVRKPGGGRKGYAITHPAIDAQFLAVLQESTAGDPMDAQVVWTDLTPQAIADLLAEQHQVRVSKSVVRKLLQKHHYRRRKAQKKQTLKVVAHRDEQFAKIATLKAEFRTAGNPIISFDTKKKEYLGNLYRAGHLYTRQELHTYDHDFTSEAAGIIIPHGIFDVQRNLGYLHLGFSKDTSEFACACLRAWWLAHGRTAYPHATALLGLCDGGGSNNSHCFIFKEDLQKLADELGLEIRIAHYPPYCSKYNPIEHRLFPHVTRACQGVIFTSVALVKELMAKTHTRQGLQVVVDSIESVYQTGRQVAADFKATMRIVFDKVLPQWNYRALPSQTVI